MLLLSVLLIGMGALIATYLVDSLTDRVSVVVLARDVPVGTQLTRDQLSTVKVSVDSTVKTIPARQLDQVVGQIARVDLQQGTMLAPSQLTGEASPAPGQQVVSAALKQSQLPARGLRPGEPVLIVATSGSGGADPAPAAGNPAAANSAAGGLPNTQATVDRVSQPDADGVLVVDLLVQETSGPAVAKQASLGRIALILTARRP